MKPLTTKQQAVLEFVVAHIADKGYPPTRTEIARHFELKPPNSAELYLLSLKEKGWVELNRGVSRGIKVVA